MLSGYEEDDVIHADRASDLQSRVHVTISTHMDQITKETQYEIECLKHFVLFDRRTSCLSMRPSCMKELYEFHEFVFLRCCGFSSLQYYVTVTQRFYSNRDNGQTLM